MTQINHAGDGGLYTELVRDRSFDELAYLLGPSPEEGQAVPLPAGSQQASVVWELLEGTSLALIRSGTMNKGNPVAACLRTTASSMPYLTHSMDGRAGYTPRSTPRLCLHLQKGVGGILNAGYWGMSVEAGREFVASVYVADAPSGCCPASVNYSCEVRHCHGATH